MTRMVVAIAVVGLSAGIAGAQSNRWVERTKADVRAGRGSFYDVVDTVLKGEQVEIVKSEDKWLSIKTPRAKTGWIFEAALANQPVAPGRSEFLRLVPGDASTSSSAASAGAKGVYAQQYAKQKGFDYGVVQWIETNQGIAANDIEAFAKEGVLRPQGGGR